jgi:uncharacterized protein YjiS (DUF1127 family)
MLWKQGLLWGSKHQQRKRLRELIALNDCLLKDIGITIEQAQIEADKPFWKD